MFFQGTRPFLPCVGGAEDLCRRTSVEEKHGGWLFQGAGRNLFGLFVWDLAEFASPRLDSDATTVQVAKAVMPHHVQRG